MIEIWGKRRNKNRLLNLGKIFWNMISMGEFYVKVKESGINTHSILVQKIYELGFQN